MTTPNRLAVAALGALAAVTGCAGGRHGPPAPAPATDPCPLASRSEPADAPSREEIIEQMECIKPDVPLCFRDEPGRLLTTSFAIAGRTGRAKLVRADIGVTTLISEHAGDDVKPASVYCLEGLFRRVRFAPFEKQVFKVTFPFKT